ncbi:hypothetical protein [Spongiactinospora sp. TRM90649]|uniref:hypothetical protein n=1 Tax=Spongiactinospora sp. TRM90649 TaxID=3031114 RepID=UPI0023F9B843|nr:hypothetical protein [Spongiactinospora sp. TRM90649]MDF5752396.1 hypothetical protein [Spongiactinospora sp. TRM90649]
MRDLLALLKDFTALFGAAREHVVRRGGIRDPRSRTLLSVAAGAIVALSVLVIFLAFGSEEPATTARGAGPAQTPAAPPAVTEPPRSPMGSVRPIPARSPSAEPPANLTENPAERDDAGPRPAPARRTPEHSTAPQPTARPTKTSRAPTASPTREPRPEPTGERTNRPTRSPEPGPTGNPRPTAEPEPSTPPPAPSDPPERESCDGIGVRLPPLDVCLFG